MKISKRAVLNLSLCVATVTLSFILIALLSGFRYEFKKFKQFLLTLAAILLIRYMFLDHIVFLIQALVLTLKDPKGTDESQTIQAENEEEDAAADYEFKPMEFLKLRLKSLKSQLNLTQNHRDETLNWEYKQLTAEFWLFGKYFFLLLLVVVYSRNSFGYYNTATTRRILNESYYSSYKIENMLNISDLYYWINDTLVASINEGFEYDGSRIEEPGWVNFHQSKLLGVVRLQQVRHAKKDNGMVRVYFDDQDYWPGWQNLNMSLSYIDNYWRIYYPWLLKHYDGAATWLMSFFNVGSLYTYTENEGYVVVLVRDLKNSGKILNYLKDNNWLDAKTAAVFVDFTLYNADSNMFTICSILVEQTPFGNLVHQINVQSAELLWNISEYSMWWWLLLVLYALQMLQFCKVMIVRSWFMPGFFKSRWNCVDFAIVLLNAMLLGFILMREYYVLHVMKTFVLTMKLEFVDFRIPCIFTYMGNVMLGLLICLASIRLWKILQFSSIFRIFNRTLYTASIPMISTFLGIHIIICAIGKSAQILNGSHSEIFSGYVKSITSILSFSFGFTSATSPEDLSHGSKIWGFILYVILMFVVAIFLINMFIALICDHFCNAREERDQESSDKLTYWQFLMEEYSFVPQYFGKLFPGLKEEENQTVNKNINDQLDEFDQKLQAPESTESPRQQERTEDQTFDMEKKRADRLQNIASVLNLQMEILDRLIMVESIEWDSDNEDID